MAGNTDYRVRVRFEAILGNLERNIRSAVTQFDRIGDAGRQAGTEGSRGLDTMTESAEEASRGLQETGSTAQRVGSVIKKALAGAAVAFVGKKVVDFGMGAVKEYGKTQTALGEMSSLGYKDLETLKKAAVDFSNTWSGTTREDFISAAYDIKSGIASLSDEGVAKFTDLAGMTAKATKSSIGEMTSLFATGHGIYRKFYDSDESFGEAFSAGIAKSVQQFKTKGSEMAASIESMGGSASSANVPLEEQLSILGMLQATMSGSEAGTKYKAFLQSSAKAGKALGLNFLDVNNQLISMPEILEQIKDKYGETMDATEKMELTTAFGTDEAVAVVDLLYDKTGALMGNIDDVASSIQGGTESVKTMAMFMNQGLLEKTDLIKQSWANLLSKMGEQMEPGITPALDNIIEKLQQMQESGDFTELGESIGRLVAAGAELLSQFLDRAPSMISALATAFTWLADNIDLVGFAVKTFLSLWAGFKIASVVTSAIGAITSAFGGLTAGAVSFRNIFMVLKNLLKTNIFGLIISLIISLIFWFVEATSGVDGWKNKFNAALLDIQLKFEKFVLILKGGLQDLLGFFNIKLAWLDKEIDKSNRKISGIQSNIDSLKGKTVNVDVAVDTVTSVAETATEVARKASGTGTNTNNNMQSSGDAVGGGSAVASGGGGGTSAPKTIGDKISDIDDKYDDEIENREIKADMATKQNQATQAKTFKEQTVELLKKQVNDLLHLENNSSGNNRTVVENARLKILQKIQDITDDIRGGINSMVGEFNTPSGLKAMTEYEYLISQGGTEQRMYYGNSNMEINLNTNGLDGASIERIKEYILDLGITGAVVVGNDYETAKKMTLQALGV